MDSCMKNVYKPLLISITSVLLTVTSAYSAAVVLDCVVENCTPVQGGWICSKTTEVCKLPGTGDKPTGGS